MYVIENFLKMEMGHKKMSKILDMLKVRVPAICRTNMIPQVLSFRKPVKMPSVLLLFWIKQINYLYNLPIVIQTPLFDSNVGASILFLILIIFPMKN